MSGEAGLRLTILGCSGSYAAAGGACTGFLIESHDANVWLDCGPGTLSNLQKHRSLGELDALVITHEHPDHWLELPVVYSAVMYYEPRGPLPVYGTVGTRELARDLCPEVDVAFDWTNTSDGDRHVIKDQTWTFSRTDHYVETLAVRIDSGGRSLVFTADTGPGWKLESLGADVDVVLAESTFLADREPAGILHLSARQAGVLATEGEAGRLLLTHLAPGSDSDAHLREAQGAFAGPVELAEVGEHYDI